MVQLWLITFGAGLLIGYFIAFIQVAHGANTTVSVPVPIMVPTLQYSPTPPVTPQVQQEPPSSAATDSVIALAISAIGIILSKLHSDNKANNLKDLVKDNMGEILKSKEVQKELARVTYSMNPTGANQITDAPAVKLETLSNDVKDFAQKAAKA